MVQIKHLWSAPSLRKSIILYITAFALLAIVLSMGTAALCYQAEQVINNSYPPIGEKYYLTNEAGEQLGEGTYIYRQAVPYTPKDEWLLALLNVLPLLATSFFSALCVIAAALLFYRNKLKQPLAELKAASEKIAKNDLDFTISCQSKDELGQLCQSFEVMRSTLAQNFSAMWRQVEERKQLNAAFAHDLRTPLTVLKGYDEILQTSADAMTRETAQNMEKQILRLERYVDSMSSLRRLEDAQPQYEELQLQEFLSALTENAVLLCAQSNKKLTVHNQTMVTYTILDRSFVTQVCHNLLSNALRYAADTVTLTFGEDDSGFWLSVADDGPGFSGDTLTKATTPYFTAEKDHALHFGLGLYICKLLCEHHGGSFTLENLARGAKGTAFFKTPSL